MPEELQIETVRLYLTRTYDQCELRDFPGELEHIFTMHCAGRLYGQVHVMRSFWDEHGTPEKVINALMRLGVTANVFKAQSKAVYVYADHLSISEDDVHTGERLE